MKHLIFICIAATRAIAPGHSLDELYRYTSAAMEMVATAPEKNDCIEDVSSTNAVERKVGPGPVSGDDFCVNVAVFLELTI